VRRTLAALERLPKRKLRDRGLDAFHRRPVSRALAACATFENDVLIVESEHDDTVPHEVISNHLMAFRKMRWLTFRVIAGADDGLSQPRRQQACTSLLLNPATEMAISARGQRHARGADRSQAVAAERVVPPCVGEASDSPSSSVSGALDPSFTSFACVDQAYESWQPRHRG
jgi:hypothetical protein